MAEKNICTRKRPCVVKRHGRNEAYDGRKVFASVYAAALNCHHPRKKAEALALRVMRGINRWAKPNRAVTASQIREKVIEGITDEDVRLMYKHHLDIS